MLVHVKVNEVAWTNGKPLKWQAVASVQCRNYDQHFYGEPMPSKETAIESLWKELHVFDTSSAQAIKYMSKKYGFKGKEVRK